jgi:hypothetical protein
MMANELFVSGCGLLTAVVFYWAFRHLPRERWQFVAAIPTIKSADNCWQGFNLTFYGFFNATAYTLACLLVILLTAAAGIPVAVTLLLVVAVLAICMPGSRWVARWVEKKPHTFSIGGAFFIGLLVTPPMVMGARAVSGPSLSSAADPLVLLSAVAIAYCWGEGVGRLACISFGCCYGKPVAEMPPRLQAIFRHWHFSFCGGTRKIAYASQLEGVQVVPVQGLTAVLYSAAALAGTYAFLNGAFRTALLLPLIVSQVWRFVSEFMRADFRGGRRISAYQLMSLFAAVYAVALAALLPVGPPPAAVSVLKGLSALWHPLVLLALQTLWIAAFIYTGKSNVTGATIQFHVHRHLI